jgi:hypothetical protein
MRLRRVPYLRLQVASVVGRKHGRYTLAGNARIGSSISQQVCTHPEDERDGRLSMCIIRSPAIASCLSGTLIGSVCHDSHDLNFSNRPVRTRMPGWCGMGPISDDRPLSRFGATTARLLRDSSPLTNLRLLSHYSRQRRFLRLDYKRRGRSPVPPRCSVAADPRDAGK